MALLWCERTKARDLLDLVLVHGQQHPELAHGQHAGHTAWEVLQVLRGQPEPGIELSPHLGALGHLRAKQLVGGNQVPFISQHDEGAILMLSGLCARLHRVQQAGVGHSKRILIAVFGQCAHFHEGHIGIGPVLAQAVEELAAQACGEAHHRMAHLFGTRAAVLRQRCVLDHGRQLQGNVLCQRMGLAFLGHAHCGSNNGSGDQIAVGPRHAFELGVFTARNHHDGRDEHLAQVVALFFVRVVVGVSRLHHFIDRLHQSLGTDELSILFGGDTRSSAEVFLRCLEGLHDLLVLQQLAAVHEWRQ